MSRLREITARLEEIRRELEDGNPSDGRAGELTEEAADLAAEAVEQVNRRLRETAEEETGGA